MIGAVNDDSVDWLALKEGDVVLMDLGDGLRRRMRLKADPVLDEDVVVMQVVEAEGLSPFTVSMVLGGDR